MKKIFIGVIIVLVMCIVAIYTLVFMPKFKNVTVSTGVKDLNVNNFLRLSIFKYKSDVVSNLEEYSLDKVGEHEVILSFGGKEYTVKLNVIDDVKPEVVIHDMSASLKYKAKAEDFITEIKDHSEYSVSIDDSLVDYNNYGDYKVIINVKDAYGNETSKMALLKLQLLYDTVDHELGNKFDLKEFVVNKEDVKKITYSNIDLINYKKKGLYKFVCQIGDKTFDSIVSVNDTKAPEIKTKDITYIMGKSKKVKEEDLLVSVTDASEYTMTRTGTIDLKKAGEYKITFTAQDIYGNKSSKTATLYVKKDNKPPVFSGLSTITTVKGQKIDYTKGVKAVDAKDGKVDFTYDASKVDINKMGEYTVYYTAKDKSGNVAKSSRKVIISHSKEDTDKLFMEFYNKYLKGKSVLEMTKTIREKIAYKAVRGSDPIWTGLTTMSGSCYVHAAMLKKALDVAGIKNVFVQNTKGSHFWVLVYQNGKWRHYDPTPGQHSTGPMTDKQRAAYQTGIGRMTWDSSYPKAV